MGLYSMNTCIHASVTLTRPVGRNARDAFPATRWAAMGATGTRDFIAVGDQIIKCRHIVIYDDVVVAVALVVVSVVAKGKGAVQPIVEQVQF
jgi:hypothetical protein